MQAVAGDGLIGAGYDRNSGSMQGEKIEKAADRHK